MTTHLAWDRGAVDDAIEHVLGSAVADALRSKTTKTMCGARVGSAHIDNTGAVECEQCRAAVVKRASNMLDAFGLCQYIDDDLARAIDQCERDLVDYAPLDWVASEPGWYTRGEVRGNI